MTRAEVAASWVFIHGDWMAVFGVAVFGVLSMAWSRLEVGSGCFRRRRLDGRESVEADPL